MTIAITPGETWEYITEADEKLPEEDQTVYELRHLTSKQQRAVDNVFAVQRAGKGRRAPKEVAFKTGDYLDRALRAGLHNVRNLQDSEGVEVPYESKPTKVGINGQQEVTDEFLARIPPGVRAELAGVILGSEELEVDEVKN